MTVDFTISGMTCLDCSRRVSMALERVDGVRSAAVDYHTGRATVEIEHEVPSEILIAAVERVGYRAALSDGTTPERAPDPSARANDVSNGRETGSEDGTPPLRDEERGRRAAPERSDRESRASTGADDFDILVVGTGGAGMAAALQAAGMGAKVGIVERGTLGGTCVNVGCIPSKALIEAAAQYHGAMRGFPGIGPCEPRFDWKAVVRKKDELVRELRQAKYADVLASYPGVAVLEGDARVLGRAQGGGLRVRVGDAEHHARKIVLAVGTSPAAPPISGLADAKPLDSTTAMGLESLPTSMIVLGGSAVGLELAQMFARFGVKVAVIEIMPRLLPGEDEAVSQALERYLAAEGLEIHTGVTTTHVERDGSQVVVHVRQGEIEGTLRAERLLVAAGRRPNTRDLGLEEVGVRVTERGFVEVDAAMRTSNASVYAAGDVTGGPGYVYVAAAGGRVAAENAVKSLSPRGASNDGPQEFDRSVVPNVTFTSPQVGSVGLTEATARARGYDIQVAILAMEQVPRALVSHDTRGFVKVIAESASGRLLGVHAVATNAGELMGEAALAIRFRLTAHDLTSTLHPYLTWGESLKLGAQALLMDVSKLSCCA